MFDTAYGRCNRMLKKLAYLRHQMGLPHGAHDRVQAARGHRPQVHPGGPLPQAPGRAAPYSAWPGPTYSPRQTIPHEHANRGAVYAESHEHDYNRRIRWLVDQQVRHENQANAHHEAGNRRESEKHSREAARLESEISQLRGMRDSEANRIHGAGYSRYADPRLIRRSNPTRNTPPVLYPPGSRYESPYRHYGYESFGKKAKRLPDGGGIKLSRGRSGTRYAQRPRPYATLTMREPVV
jgi:hypothetical protein